MIDKNLILISYLQTLISNYLFKSEYSTNDKDKKVVVVSIRPGEKEVLFGTDKNGRAMSLNDTFEIQIFGDSIREEKTIAEEIGSLIGSNVIHKYNNENYQIMFHQISNPQSIMYEDIRRVGYTMTLRTLINKI